MPISKRSGQTKNRRRGSVVLGFDPGITRTGWGVIRAHNRTFRAQGAGTLRPKGKTLSEKLLSLSEQVNAVIRSVKPDAVAVEAIFWNPRYPGGLVLAHARSVLLLASASNAVPVTELSPRTVKHAVALFGGADKKDVARGLSRFVTGTIPHADSLDATDALAVALACALLSS